MAKNLFCNSTDLKNEADVETWFVSKLLDYLGYAPEDINLKTSIEEYKVGKGSKSILYKPDYVVLANRFPTLIIDAKHSNESLCAWLSQCSSYCLEVNRLYRDHNPVVYFILSNGLATTLFRWDRSDPIVELAFGDFARGNPKLHMLEELIGKDALIRTATAKHEELMDSEFRLEPVPLEQLSNLLIRLHNFIRSAEKKTPAAAFEELIKIVFIKIKKDRELRLRLKKKMPKVKDVVFSLAWIKSQTESANPINDPLFKNLVRELETEVLAKNKRRIFDANENINLHASTIERIVEEFEHIDFYEIDDDIHGRMFESFLDATTRGKALGQFFTPRDIVQLVVALAAVEVRKDRVETVLDACCGSGGFLIAATGVMLRKADELVGLSSNEKKALHKRITCSSLFGIDAGSDPAMHRIAGMNMYLHEDGGSNVYFADSLDKRMGQVGRSDLELDREIAELRKLIVANGTRFDVILSNPPFSMKYSRDHREQREILKQYEIGRLDRQASSLPSSVMFLERYKELVSDGGRIFAIIDESILSGEKYRGVRNYIRSSFLIRAVISLPGDAFRRADARVKTSIIVLQPRKADNEQAEVFMEKAIYLGLTPKTAKRIGISKEELGKGKSDETNRITSEFHKFLRGERANFVIPVSGIADRLDVKNCLGDIGRRKSAWETSGFKVEPLASLLSQVTGRSVKVDEEETYSLLKVTYDGEVLESETKFGGELSYARLFKVQAWDILFSNINVGRGAIGVVPDYLAGR